jgi:hypothetical protein
VSVFELNMFDFVPLGCSVDLGFYHVLVVRTALPLAMIGTLALTGRWLKSRRKTSASNSFFSACFFFIFLLSLQRFDLALS